MTSLNINENTSLTENGDKTYASSLDCCLDFFTQIVRNTDMNKYILLFIKCWNESKETILQILMNLRDIRKGKGEKIIPITIMVLLKHSLPSNQYESLLNLFLNYGSWKDLLRIYEINIRYCNKLKIKSNNNIELKLFANQLLKDNNLYESSLDKTVAISLCAKWAPTENTHFDKHPLFAAKQISKLMNMSIKDYRLILTKLRKHLNILEMLMATNNYDKIDFSKISSVAMMKMKNAFKRDCNSKGVKTNKRENLKLSYEEY